AVRLEQVVATFDVGYLLSVELGGQGRRGEAAWRTKLVEPVPDDEQADKDDREKSNPACRRGLADDARRALRGQAGVRPDRRRSGEPLGRQGLLWDRRREPLLGVVAAGLGRPLGDRR